MRKLNRNRSRRRPGHQRIRRGVLLLLGPVVAASLIVATPGTSAAVTTAPDVAATDSVDVTDVPTGANLPDVGAESTKTVPLPEVTWPKPEDAVEIPVTEDAPEGADPDQPLATTDDPTGAPETISVEPVGKLPENSAAGLGAAYRITTPTPTASPTTPEAPTTPESPAPSTDGVGQAWFNRTVSSGLFSPVDDPTTPAPTETPAPSEPSPTITPETPDPTDPPTIPTDPGEDPAPTDDPYTSDVDVQLSYADFAGAYGGDWASRLQAVLLTDCTGDTLNCATVTPLKSANDTENQTVTVTVPADAYADQTAQAPALDQGQTPSAFAPAVNVIPVATSPGSSAVALTAGSAGSTGAFTASPLSLSSSWHAGGNTGEFSWSYPLGVTPAAQGPNPDLALSYSSGAVDGRTASSNNQASRIGEGFDLDPGFIERSYVPCKDDKEGAENAPVDSTDLCWSNRNLTLSLGGKSSRLVTNDDGTHWRLLSDDGTNIYRVNGYIDQSTRYQEEFWVAVTPDGTKYYFGRNKRFDGDTRSTDSVSKVRVYGNHSLEPWHATSFADSWSREGWRWSLDYVVDPNDNTMSLFYQQEQNRYGAEDDTVRSLYDRGARLEHIEYGSTTTRDLHNKSAPYRVDFDQDGRCTIPNSSGHCNIDDLNSDSADEWPDVPYDQLCYDTDVDAHCPKAPTFFTLYRTATITNLVRNSTNDGYITAQTWTLNHSFPRTGDTTTRTLWLGSIEHTNLNIVQPTTSFSGTQLANRVDTTGDAIAPFVKWRVAAIRNGVGGVISINYNSQESAYACSWADKPSDAAPYNNNKLCYASSYQPDWAEDPQIEFFHKYVVDSVVESDVVGRSPNVVTKYTYKDGGAWHYDESNLVPFKYRTWNDWRGFAKVVTEVGGAGARTWSESAFMRGMDGDRGPNGTTRTASVVDKSADGTKTFSPTIPDVEGTAGFVRRTRTSLDGGDHQISNTVNTHWLSNATASENGYFARYLRTGAVDTTISMTVTGEIDRVTHTDTVFDGSGRPVKVFDDGDKATTDDDRCTETTYATVSGPSVPNQVATQLTHRGDCAMAVDSDDDVISSVRNYYDNQAVGGPLTRRNLTKVETAKGWSNQWVTDAEMTYDPAGRVTSVKDAAGKTTETQYTLGSDQGDEDENNIDNDNIVTNVSTTNPLGQTTSTTLHRKWGTPTQTTDVAGHTTTLEYDYVGRLIKVWTPGRSTSLIPNYAFDYVTVSTGSQASTSVLNANGGTTTSRVFYDGLLRERQTQAPAAGPDGGRLITENRYDSHGWLESKRGPYYNEQPVDGTLVSASANTIPSYTDFTYDRAGRPTTQALMSYGKQKSASQTTYGNVSVSVKPPTGGTPTTTTTDARGQTVSLKQYDGPDTTSPVYTDTTYTYTPAGRLKTVTSAGSTWTYGYDIRGNQRSANDPDKGTTATTYDVLGRVESTTDASNKTLWTVYDDLGRKTQLRDNNASGSLRASWAYDTVQAGQLSSSTRYDGADQYTNSVTDYDDAGRPTGTKLMLPNNTLVGGLYKAAGYTSTMSYYEDGSPKQVTQPSTAGTGVTNEPLNYTYDNLGNLDTMTGAGALVAGTTYTPFGEVAQRVLGPTIGKSVYDSREYDDATGRLTRQAVSLQTSATTTQMDQRYGYDETGNVTSLNDYANGDSTGGSASTFKQCFTYDNLRRMTQAWASSTATCAAPTVSTLGTQSPYWDKYTYSQSGNRTQWIQVRGAGGSSSTTHTSTYPSPGSPRPHAVTTVASTGTSPQSETLDYDDVGNTKSRTGATSGDQTIHWDAEGHQTDVVNSATTRYVYDADGNRILKSDGADNSTTLYVGSSEYKIKAGTKTLIRNYSAGGQPVATRTANGLTVVLADRNNSGQLAIDGASLVVQKRRFSPFGEDLQTVAGWPNDHGYLDKTKDSSTGTTHLGAREFDPKLGRFLSVDPVLDLADPQSMNGYAYANNTPVTSADPSGLRVDGGQGADLSNVTPDGRWCSECSTVHWRFNQSGYDQSSPKVWTNVFGGIINHAGDLSDLAMLANPGGLTLRAAGVKPGEALSNKYDELTGATGKSSAYGLGGSIFDVIPIGGGAGTGARLGARGLAGVIARFAEKKAANTAAKWGLDELSQSGARASKGGLTQAGRKFSQHGGQGAFPTAKGSVADLNRLGQHQLDDILTSPGTVTRGISGGNFAGGRYYIAPDGRGAAFDADGAFQYFGVFKP